MEKLALVAKMAVVFTVVDAFIPRAEVMAKSKMHQHHHSEKPSSGEESKRYGMPQMPRYHPHHPQTEMHMGLFDLSPFHGGGSANKDALDEQWEIQQEILRARRGDEAHYVKRRAEAAPKVEIKASKKGGKVEVDDAAHHQKKAPKFFWDLGKSGH